MRSNKWIILVMWATDQAPYRFIELDMSTGLDEQSTSLNGTRYVDTELAGHRAR